MAIESGVDPIYQLEQAVRAVPPDVAAARTAIVAVAEALPAASDEERAHMVQQTAALAGQLATSVLEVRRFKGAKAVSQEFTAHAQTYGSLARVLGIEMPVQAAPTQTAGKALSGGKK